jgi:hypothetical protein
MEIAKKAMHAQFKRDPTAVRVLLDTNDSPIRSAFDWETVHSTAVDRQDSGVNEFGNLLEVIRSELRSNDGKEDLGEPPWIRYPDWPPEDLGWRMGGGEHYLTEWTERVRALSPGEKDVLQRTLDVPPEWAALVKNVLRS